MTLAISILLQFVALFFALLAGCGAGMEKEGRDKSYAFATLTCGALALLLGAAALVNASAS